MRVEGARGQSNEPPPRERIAEKRRPGGAGRGTPARPASFAEELHAAVGAETTASPPDWDALVRTLDEKGRELLAHPDPRHLEAYKRAVRGFLTAAVRAAFRVRVVEGRGPAPKLYVMVENVEAKLDELARTVLSSQRDPLKLLAQVEELRGLLLDLKT